MVLRGSPDDSEVIILGLVKTLKEKRPSLHQTPSTNYAKTLAKLSNNVRGTTYDKIDDLQAHSVEWLFSQFLCVEESQRNWGVPSSNMNILGVTA